MKRKQEGVFVIELAFVLLFISMLLVFVGDIALQLLTRGNLDRASYSLVNVLKERTHFYGTNNKVTDTDVNNLYTLAARLLPKDAVYGIRVEWMESLGDDDYTYMTPGKLNGAEGETCLFDESAIDSLNIVPKKSSEGKSFSLYKVTLCVKVESWFYRFTETNGKIGEHFIHSSSVMPGR